MDDSFPFELATETRQEQSTTDLPTVPPDISGVIPRVEERPGQLAFVREADIDTVMMDTYRAERLLNKGETTESLFPGATVILSTTFEDERLEDWTLEREISVASRFGADTVVPCDIPVYKVDPRSQRVEDVQVYADNVIRAVEAFAELGIDVIPLVKGTNAHERGICYDAFNRAGITYVAFYCAQYFLYGNRYRHLLATIRDAVREFDPDRLMLIGYQSENDLSDFPPAVKAVAGRRWFRKSELASEPVAVAIRKYEDWERDVNSALQTGQSLLDSFGTQPSYGGI
jgi:hypothetical protein